VTSYLLTGDTLNGRGKAGAALILAGVLMVELKPNKLAAETNVSEGTSL